jgi:hypothetical protein
LTVDREDTHLLTVPLHFAGQDGSRGPTRDVDASVLIESGPDEEAPGEVVWYYVTVTTPGLPITLTEHEAAEGKLALTVETFVGGAADGEYIWCDLTVDLHDPRGWRPQPNIEQVEDGGAGQPHNVQPDRVIVQVFERRVFDRAYYADDRGCKYDL